MPEMTQNNSPPKTKHRKKNRESHNEVERHRKKKINSGINRIGDLIPCSPALKQSKNMILEEAFKYITELKRQNDELLLNGGDKEQAIEIRKLRKELAEILRENAHYIELLKSNDICLYDDPTLHWKGSHKNLKASLVVPADQVQKPLCLSGNQLNSNNSTAAVHGITFNVGNNLQKQTANVVPVQRTCNIVTPITISGMSLLESKAWQQSAASITSSNQQAPLCLPLTTPAPITVSITSTVERSVLVPISSACHPLLNSSASQIQCSSTQTSLLGENRMQGNEGTTHPDNLPKVSPSISSSLPSNLSSLVPEVPLVSVSGTSLQESVNLLQGQLQGSASCAVNDVIQDIFPNITADSSLHIANSSREVVTAAVEIATGSTVCTSSATPLENSWSLSALPTQDLRSIGSLARVPSHGNTQTTWTTLQIARSTIQPLSQAPPSGVPMLLTEKRLCPKEVIANRPTPCINLNSLASDTGKPVEQVMVKMSSCQPVHVQSLISQPQAATNILPLNQPVQVIQVAQPVTPAVNPAPANQNIIFFQPPAPAPCTPVIRAEAPKPTIGQQIVIIQAAPNQNPLPLMQTQATPPVVVPLNPANPAICPSNTVQSTAPPQTFGGKHLVHILPRPATLVAPSTTQSVPTSTASSNQQPPTISLNGQLFALQPVTPSAGTSSQTHMQIIQPTTNEDPNTNVALNTFGALANLSQSISQIAGQSCLQFSVNPSAASVSSANIPLNSVSTSGASTTAESPSITSPPAKAACAKHPGGSPTTKAKKAIKKISVKKSASTRKDNISSNKLNKSESLCVESSKLPCTGEFQKHQENACAVTSAQVNSNVSDISLPKGGNPERVQESITLAVLNSGMEERLLPESGESCPSELSSTSDHGSGANACIIQIPDSSSESLNISAGPTCQQPMHDTTVGVCTSQAGVSAAGPSQVLTGSDSCASEINTAALTATDLLEAQILLGDRKGKSLPLVVSTKEMVGDELIYKREKSKESVSSEQVKEDVSLLPIAAVSVSPNKSGTTEQEMGVCSSVVNSRQTDSPMSTSSSSSRNFSVASMLPDTSREDVTSNAAPVPEYTGCPFAEQSDIVAVAARAIFEQENLAKGRPRPQPETPAPVSSNSDAALLMPDCRNHYKPLTEKQSFIQLPAKSTSFTPLDTNPIPTADPMEEKNNCPVGINTTNLSLNIPLSQSQNVTSLSIKNLIQHGGTTHSIVNFANASQTLEQVLPLPTPSKPVLPSGNYESQAHRSSALSEYSQEQLHSVRSTVMQVTHTTESLLKQSEEHRKDSNKRSAHEDDLLSTAKRPKQCQAPLRLERIQAPDGLREQNEIMVSRMPSNTSSSVSGGNTVHEAGLVPLFSSSNSFVRQSDLRCSSQTSVSEHQHGQMVSQHLIQQHTPNHQGPLHHSSVPYLKQQQQAGHLREQHHLYQQQHHGAHAESAVHAQSRSVQQQRLIQQDVQMQKKQAPVQNSQPTRMSLQHKQHLSEQNCPKGAQTHQSHHQPIQQQMQPHFGPSQADKTCENTASNRSHRGTHPQSHVSQDILHQHQQDVGSRTQGPPVSSEHLPGHNQVQRLMTSRSLEQQLVSQPSIISRPTNMTCTPHRQERNRVSSYSAEALIGKSTSNSEQRMGLSIQGSRFSEQLEMRKYLDISRNKGLEVHNIQGQLSIEHSLNTDAQCLPDCQSFKAGGSSQQQRGSFDAQTLRPNDTNSGPSMRGVQSQAYRITQNPNLSMDQQKHLSYQPAPEVPLSNTLPIRDSQNSCHQSFMQSLLTPHIEQVGVGQRLISSNQRHSQYNAAPGGVEYSCPASRDSVHLRRDGNGQNRESCDLAIAQVTSRSHSLSIPFSSSTSSVEIPGRSSSSPNASMQKSNAMRPHEAQGAKNHLNIQVSINMHGVVHPTIPQQSVSHSNLDQRQNVRQLNPPITQHSRHLMPDNADSKGRQPERNRHGNQRQSNMFEHALPHLPLTGPSSMIIGRQQPVNDKRPGIVRFMADNAQISSDNPAPDQHSLTQNFGFPFIPEGTMNPPINANSSFIPPVTQAAATRTPAVITVDPQNPLPSFYPPYSPAHPSLSNDITIPYFPNQMFPNPGTEKTNSTGLNNRFGTILSPPRPVGFSQATFPLLPDMPPMHMANPSHLSNFNLMSLFPEIATALPTDGSAMSPLLSISHSSGSDSSKQSSNRPAHNISHILGHDSSSAV
ncbi:basic helix-loop-helix domain-containing protein USF3 isoform X2 [Xenopus laevis]|nr:basic helix-loop-helix domain-containing protein USF3 isoform X2 [Xenopus laevis]XP_018104479.1 basic helix-loop-helix domain-containing protein USF3 isoform X2 [Xenopus laevis]XP_018104480.1 basic helix-loop-helix domain-containing protein USF3 isoform X2 [Xenopus laevis]XP_018104481.1 basic helix-loop-helix domain-containing protein USF3 isoform X2 [Xenopus laevis]XP_041439444.1 basic helix-loop-helix domain-containing protein USF3 isoform X2 [Xenopus laevis]